MKILVVEDDPTARQVLSDLLERDGFGVRATPTAEKGLPLLSQAPFDLVILDLGLPGMTGHEMLRFMRSAEHDTPVLVLSGRDDPETIVQSFALGADDFLAKPYSFKELSARIRAIGRRVRDPMLLPHTVNGISMNPEACTMSADGGKVMLSRTEYQFLELLVRHKGQTVTRQMILNRLYAGKNAPQEKIIDAYAWRLRKKFAESFQGTVRLKTVWGRGYVLEVNANNAGGKPGCEELSA